MPRETATFGRGNLGRRFGVCAFSFLLSGECSLGAHGLLRFRTNDVLLGTSGVGVCVSVVSNSPGMLYRFRTATSLSLAAIPCWIPFRKRKVASSKPALTLIYFSHLCGLNFCSRCLLQFDPAFSGSRLVRCSFSSREAGAVTSPPRRLVGRHHPASQQSGGGRGGGGRRRSQVGTRSAPCPPCLLEMPFFRGPEIKLLMPCVTSSASGESYGRVHVGARCGVDARIAPPFMEQATDASRADLGALGVQLLSARPGPGS